MNSIVEHAQAMMLAQILSDEEKIAWLARMLAESSEVIEWLENIAG